MTLTFQTCTYYTPLFSELRFLTQLANHHPKQNVVYRGSTRRYWGLGVTCLIGGKQVQI